jgi:adenosylcobinamide-phosphate synthase
MYQHLIALFVGYAIDLVVGDPQGWPHPIRLIGALISCLERHLRARFPQDPAGEKRAGILLVISVVAISWLTSAAVLILTARVSRVLSLVLECVMVAYMLATTSLARESKKVYACLRKGDLQGARAAVSLIVGRDTDKLDERGVVRAAVETVAENTSDGVVAPLLYMALGGALLGVAYKAINTMDSMVGYKNERYLHFGWAAARADDVANFVPARIAGLLMCAAARLVRLDARRAFTTMRKDHVKSTSPNAGFTEAACAGALGVELGGDNSYFGTVVHKPTMGEKMRPLEAEDIIRSHRLLYATSLLCLILSAGISWLMAQVGGVALWI